jgi:hypothetical protein
MKSLFLTISLAVVLSSCFRRDDHIQKEGLLELTFLSQMDTINFTRIEAEGSKRLIPTTKPYRLPVNCGADYTRYFLYSGTTKDTLTIGYKREFSFSPDNNEGYLLRLDYGIVLVNTLSGSGRVRFTGNGDSNVVGEITLMD